MDKTTTGAWTAATNYMQLIAESSLRPGLRSADTADYIKRRTRTTFAERCFSHAGPAACNSLPDSIQLIELHLLNVASVTLVQLPGIPYLTVFSLPRTLIGF